MLLCSSLTAVSEWKSRLFEESVWGESNASWQWIVSIDSSTPNSLPLHTASCMSLPWVCVCVCMCVCVCVYVCVCVCVRESMCAPILLEQNKNIDPTWEFNKFHVFSYRQGKNLRSIFLSLIESDRLFQATPAMQGQEGRVHVDLQLKTAKQTKDAWLRQTRT